MAYLDRLNSSPVVPVLTRDGARDVVLYLLVGLAFGWIAAIAPDLPATEIEDWHGNVRVSAGAS